MLDTLLTREETAKRLHVSVTTVDRLRRSHCLRGVKVGRRVLFRPQEIEAFAADSLDPTPREVRKPVKVPRFATRGGERMTFKQFLEK